MFSPRWRKVVRDIWDNKSRTVLVILSIAIGVFAFGGLFIARVVGSDELNGQYRETNSSHIIMSLPPFDEHLVNWMARQDHVIGAQGRIVYSAKVIEAESTHNLTLIAYEDFEAIDIGVIYPEAGAWPPERDAILIERSSVGLTNLEIDDLVVLEMIDGRRYELQFTGTVHDLNAVPGTIQSQLTGYVTLRTLRTLNLPAIFNQVELRIDPDYLASSPQSSLDTLTHIANDIQEDLKRRGTTVNAVNVREADQHWAADVMDGISTILIIVGLVSLLLSGFLVVNTISGLLAQQKRQIGIMKVIGASRPQIISVYLVMVIFLGLIALMIAIPASMALGRFLLVDVMSSFLNFDIRNFHLPFDILVLQIAVAIVSPIVSALVPILNGTSMTAADAISDYAVQGRSGVLDMLLAQIRGLSRPILVSVRNTFRRKIRLAMTLITLTVAGALFMSIMNVRTALLVDVADQLRMSNFDVQVFLAGLYDRDGMERRLEQIPGIEQAEGWARATVQRIRPDATKGGTFPVIGLPYDSTFVDPPIIEGRWLQMPLRLGQNNIVITTDLLSDEPDIELGDTITLELNGEEDDWNVVGILISSNPAAYTHYDDLTHFQKFPNVTPTLVMETRLHDDVSQMLAGDALSRFFDLRNIGVARIVTRAELEQDTFGGFDILISILIGMAIIVAAVGGLGLAGTMSLNVLERTREIGVMRAVGASTNTIRQMFILEGVLIGFLSAIIALPLSTPGSIMFGNVLGEVLANRPLPFTPTTEGPLAWFLIITLISGTASLMPAQRASQISVREALAYE